MLKRNLHLCFSRIHCLPSSRTYTLEQEDETTKCCNSEATDGGETFSSSSSSTTTTTATEPDFTTVFASRRFFFSSPGASNSILDDGHSAVPGGGVPVRKYSPDPYVDFRKSMGEMVRARRREMMLHPTAENEPSDEYEYLQQLLLCYLSLNPKNTHKFIIGAFTDLLLSLMLSELPVFDGPALDTSLEEGFWCS